MDPNRSYYQHASELARRTSGDIPQRPRRPATPEAAARRRKGLLRVAAFFLVLAVAAYVYDSFAIRYIVSPSRQFGAVDVDWFESVPQKGGKIEYFYDHIQSQRCVNSLFPHFGMPPCWYARRHTQKSISL